MGELIGCYETCANGYYDASPKPLVQRSPHWPAVRETHLKREPNCTACGGKDNIEVHHIHPFHLWPELELVETNLITLCEHPSHNCHFIFGHLLSWLSYNLTVQFDAAAYLLKLSHRPKGKGDAQ